MKSVMRKSDWTIQWMRSKMRSGTQTFSLKRFCDSFTAHSFLVLLLWLFCFRLWNWTFVGRFVLSFFYLKHQKLHTQKIHVFMLCEIENFKMFAPKTSINHNRWNIAVTIRKDLLCILFAVFFYFILTFGMFVAYKFLLLSVCLFEQNLTQNPPATIMCERKPRVSARKIRYVQMNISCLLFMPRLNCFGAPFL